MKPYPFCALNHLTVPVAMKVPHLRSQSGTQSACSVKASASGDCRALARGLDASYRQRHGKSGAERRPMEGKVDQRPAVITWARMLPLTGPLPNRNATA